MVRENYRLGPQNSIAANLDAHPRKRPKRIIRQNVYPLSPLSVSRQDSGGRKWGGTRWLVLRLSICLRNTIIHRSLQMNLITSSVSTILGLSLENLFPVSPPKRRGGGKRGKEPLNKSLTDFKPQLIQSVEHCFSFFFFSFFSLYVRSSCLFGCSRWHGERGRESAGHGYYLYQQQV